ncbi:hypothetical protein RchiOBHm_Chr6g0269031 [Rosa chinensis]|uniref:Uncharacterized protein n=1 Tax=Rosa chinensis TaxID=74649 RepID=A0A2P6PQE9_ROSCH|nr:hypothetical protein RchiOBHm_Chr6g0269031 [Rosa chinensis]
MVGLEKIVSLEERGNSIKKSILLEILPSQTSLHGSDTTFLPIWSFEDSYSIKWSLREIMKLTNSILQDYYVKNCQSSMSKDTAKRISRF